MGKKKAFKLTNEMSIEEAISVLEKKHHHDFTQAKTFNVYTKASYFINSDDRPYVYFSSPKNWNDRMDAKSFEDDDYEFFVCCFNIQSTENIEMWNMYAPYGLRITYPTKHIKGIVSGKTEKTFSLITDEEPINVKEEDIKKYFKFYGWTIGYLEKSFRTKTIAEWRIKNSYGVNPKYFDRCLYQAFLKNRLWLSERECRVAIAIKKEFFNNISESNNIKGIKVYLTCDPKDITVIKSPIPDEDDFLAKLGMKNELFTRTIKDSVHQKDVNVTHFKEENINSISQSLKLSDDKKKELYRCLAENDINGFVDLFNKQGEHYE